jgi:hypothetical protein
MSLADFVPCPSVQPGPAPYAGSVVSISPATSERNDVHATSRAVRAQSAGGRCSQTARKSPHDVDHASDG